MAIASAAPQFVLYLTLYPYFMAHVLGVSYTRLMGRALGAGLVAATVTIAIGLGIRILLPPLSWFSFAANITVVLVGLVLTAWLVVVEPSDKAWLRRRIFGNSVQ